MILMFNSRVKKKILSIVENYFICRQNSKIFVSIHLGSVGALKVFVGSMCDAEHELFNYVVSDTKF